MIPGLSCNYFKDSLYLSTEKIEKRRPMTSAGLSCRSAGAGILQVARETHELDIFPTAAGHVLPGCLFFPSMLGEVPRF
jgi:hypothetical protein